MWEIKRVLWSNFEADGHFVLSNKDTQFYYIDSAWFHLEHQSLQKNPNSFGLFTLRSGTGDVCLHDVF